MAETVLIAIDFSRASSHALAEAARRFPDAKLVVVHAVDPAFSARVAAMTGLDVDDLQRRSVNRADSQLDETLGSLRSAGRDVHGGVVEGDLVTALAAAAARHHVSTVVLGLEHREALDRLPWQVAAAAGVATLLLPDEPTT